MFSLSLIQMKVLPGKKKENLARIAVLVERARREGGDVVLLPETCDLGWGYPAGVREADPIPDGKTCRTLRNLAARERIYLCAGLTERCGSAFFNSAVLIDPSGRVVLHHRKINELTIAHEVYGPGDRLGVHRSDLGSFGLMICADATSRDHVLSRSLGYMGADVILSPSAWAVPAAHDNVKEPYGGVWRDAYGPVAKEFGVWIAGCSNVGPVEHGAWKGWNCIGCSMVVDPDGAEILKGPYGAEAETVLHARIEPLPRPARGTGWWDVWNAKKTET